MLTLVTDTVRKNSEYFVGNSHAGVPKSFGKYHKGCDNTYVFLRLGQRFFLKIFSRYEHKKFSERGSTQDRKRMFNIMRLDLVLLGEGELHVNCSSSSLRSLLFYLW